MWGCWPMTMVRQKDKDHLWANAVSEDVDHGEVGRVFLLLLVPLGSRSSPGGDHEDQDGQDGDDQQKKDDQDVGDQEQDQDKITLTGSVLQHRLLLLSRPERSFMISEYIWTRNTFRKWIQFVNFKNFQMWSIKCQESWAIGQLCGDCPKPEHNGPTECYLISDHICYDH